MNSATQILPFLYVGGYLAAIPSGVTHVFSVGHPYEGELDPRIIVTPEYACEDAPETDMIPLFSRVCRLIEAARASGGVVYVHCVYGQCRSPAVVIAYMCAYLGYKFNAAYAHVQARRTEAAIYCSWRLQIEMYAKNR
jgi:protein-tyrosine phosphatase